MTCALSYSIGTGAHQLTTSFIQFDAWVSNAVSAAEVPNVGKTALTALLCFSCTYPTLTAAPLSLATGDTLTVRARKASQNDQSLSVTIVATNTYTVPTPASWVGGTNVINQPNVLLYFQTPLAATYFANNLAFTITGGLTASTGNFVAVYASFPTTVTVTATDSTL